MTTILEIKAVENLITLHGFIWCCYADDFQIISPGHTLVWTSSCIHLPAPHPQPLAPLQYLCFLTCTLHLADPKLNSGIAPIDVEGNEKYREHSLWKRLFAFQYPSSPPVVIWTPILEVNVFCRIPCSSWLLTTMWKGYVLFSILLLRIDGNLGAERNQTEEASEWAAGRNIGPQSSHSYTELPTSSC